MEERVPPRRQVGRMRMTWKFEVSSVKEVLRKGLSTTVERSVPTVCPRRGQQGPRGTRIKTAS